MNIYFINILNIIIKRDNGVFGQLFTGNKRDKCRIILHIQKGLKRLCLLWVETSLFIMG